MRTKLETKLSIKLRGWRFRELCNRKGYCSEMTEQEYEETVSQYDGRGKYITLDNIAFLAMWVKTKSFTFENSNEIANEILDICELEIEWEEEEE